MTKWVLTNLDNGEQFTFDMMVQVEEFLGKSKTVVQRCARLGNNCFDQKGNRFDILAITDRKAPIKNNNEQQLCCTCKNFAVGCEWSERFEPVRGWTATPTILNSSERLIKSYHITACPKYAEG